MSFSEIKSREELAFFLDIPLKLLTYILYKRTPSSFYVSFEIPKKNGDVRLINAPTRELKSLQKTLANALYDFQSENNCINKKISHGFERHRSIISNAETHRNKRYVLNFDFENFFDCFHYGRVRGFFEKNRNFRLPIDIATIIAQLTCYEGSLPQGAPTSPVITNLICNILDLRLIKIAKKYKLDFTRYADDLTFSTNDKHFAFNIKEFYIKVKYEVEKFGLNINDKKTRLLFKDSRQEVTGLVVNKKVNVKRDYYKKTRAMADSLYKTGNFKIDSNEGTIKQLEGRFAYINQIDHYNNVNDGKKHDCWKLNSREKQYQKFLFYKYFYNNQKPIIITEGKTDIIYIRSALKKDYLNYPNLIVKKDDDYDYKVTFLRRTKRLKYFFKLDNDGADTLKNIYFYFTGKNNFCNLYNCLEKKNQITSKNPVILVFDNEQISKKPLRGFLGCTERILPKGCLSLNIIANLYLLTNPLVRGKKECEIEDLFDKNTLNHKIGNKTFSRLKEFDKKRHYGKAIFSKYVSDNYNNIDFNEFAPMLTELNEIVKKY